jgi:hypothetical protein
LQGGLEQGNPLKKSRGRLGLGSIYNKNLALLFKWMWNLDNRWYGGWQEFIVNKYKPCFDNGLPTFDHHLSPTWYGIYKSLTSFWNFSSCKSRCFF